MSAVTLPIPLLKDGASRPQVSPRPQAGTLAQRRRLPNLSIPMRFQQAHVPDHHDIQESQPAEFQADYSLGAQLGEGTTAVVRLATRRTDGRQFAVKHTRSVDEEYRQFICDEYDLVRSLNHPSIIKFDALYASAVGLWICMDFCSDGDVDRYISEHGPFDDDMIRGRGLQMIRGVSYLHKKRVVHRDLKPQNMLLQKGAQLLKISDFNSAKRIGKKDGSSLMLTDRGTRTYTAPELRFGLHWNERVDIWSCGLCLYFMRRGELPFDILDGHTKDCMVKGRLPEIEWEGFTDALQNLTQQCLTVDMRNRPQAMELCLHPMFRRDMLRKSPRSPRRSCSPRKRQSPRKDRDSKFADGCVSVSFLTDAFDECLESPEECFTYLPGCGLLALREGLSPVDFSEDFPQMEDSGKCRWSNDTLDVDIPGDGAGSASSCYLFGASPSMRSMDCEDVTPASKPARKSYASFKAPRHFDALLRLATSMGMHSRGNESSTRA